MLKKEQLMVKAISILGCTGSIGRQTLRSASTLGLRVAALTANRQIDRLEEQARFVSSGVCRGV